MRRVHVVSLLVVVLVAVGSLAGVLYASWAPVLGVQLQGGVEVVLRPATEVEDDQLDQAIEIIRSRVDALGVAEPDITRQGTQVVIQLPGVRDRQRAVDLVGQTAELRFRPVIGSFLIADEENFSRGVHAANSFNSQLDALAVEAAGGDGTGTGDQPTAEEPTGDEPTGDEPTFDIQLEDDGTGTGDEPTFDIQLEDDGTGTGDAPTFDIQLEDDGTGTGDQPTIDIQLEDDGTGTGDQPTIDIQLEDDGTGTGDQPTFEIQLEEEPSAEGPTGDQPTIDIQLEEAPAEEPSAPKPAFDIHFDEELIAEQSAFQLQEEPTEEEPTIEIQLQEEPTEQEPTIEIQLDEDSTTDSDEPTIEIQLDDDGTGTGDEPTSDGPTIDIPLADVLNNDGETPVIEIEAPLPDPVLTTPDNDLVDRAVVLPDSDQIFGYALAPTEMTGEVVEDAVATFHSEWVVNLDLTPEGSVQFDEIARTYFENQVAIVLDGLVESAPTINATEFGGTAVISGNFTAEEAQDLALVLRFGALPVEFIQDDVRTVSATLGEGTLRAGVIAGIVGLMLVGFYMLFYYRLLGLVAIGSLMISGAILWSLISWLGESRGLALTLAGITGIIVSIGVQVDSNIVYYERIKEEVRRGRAVRSAADASFTPAFTTIVWADLASLIGAGVLYQLTSGTVRGFALYLGIATLIDLAVSYFFMRPLVVFIVRKMVGDRVGRLGMSIAERNGPGQTSPAQTAPGQTSPGQASPAQTTPGQTTSTPAAKS